KREQDAIELPAMKRLARRGTGLFAQVQLERWPLLAKPRQHRWKQERCDGRDDSHAQLAVQRAALRARHFRQLLGFAKHVDGLVGDLLAEGGKPDDTPRPLDKGDAEQRL